MCEEMIEEAISSHHFLGGGQFPPLLPHSFGMSVCVTAILHHQVTKALVSDNGGFLLFAFGIRIGWVSASQLENWLSC